MNWLTWFVPAYFVVMVIVCWISIANSLRVQAEFKEVPGDFGATFAYYTTGCVITLLILFWPLYLLIILALLIRDLYLAFKIRKAIKELKKEYGDDFSKFIEQELEALENQEK